MTQDDVVGVSSINKDVVVGECKFTNDKIDKEVYDTLLRRSNLLANRTVKAYLLFSLKGYTKWFDTKKPDDFYLCTLEDMY